jgi:SAM-dependent methyltransferase
MQKADIRKQWEGAAPGWARWEATVATWMEPATEAMLAMAGVDAGARVLDLASGAGSQTLRAAQRVGAHGHVVASDIADTMLHHVQENARVAGLSNVSTLAGAAEDLDVAAESFDAVICRLGLMLFVAPAQALAAVRRSLRPGGKVAVVVFTTPAANPFMARPMQILLRHAGKAPTGTGATRDLCAWRSRGDAALVGRKRLRGRRAIRLCAPVADAVRRTGTGDDAGSVRCLSCGCE